MPPTQKLGIAESLNWLFAMSQPFITIRLPTYPFGKLPDGRLQSLGYSGVARHYCRNRCLLSLPRLTKMFQFRRLPLLQLWIHYSATRHNSSRVSPFGHLRIKACSSAPRSLSQIATSFIGILRQGIHCARLSNFLRCPFLGGLCNWLVVGDTKKVTT